MLENFNFSQSLISLVEAYLLTGKGKESLVYAASTLIATGVTDLNLGIVDKTATNEKYLVEPIISVILAILGKSFLLTGKEGKSDKYMKTGISAFLLTSSSAAVNNVINFGYMRQTNPAFANVSSYSQARSVLAAQKEANPTLPMTFASSVVA